MVDARDEDALRVDVGVAIAEDPLQMLNGTETAPLAGSDAVDLCIAVSLPSSVVGTGGGTAEVTFDVLAEQADV